MKEGEICSGTSNFAGAVESYEGALQESRHFPSSDRRRGDTLEDLGHVLGNLQRYTESEARLKECLENRISCFGEEHELVAIVLQRLGESCMYQKKKEQTIDYFQRELQMLVKLKGDSDRSLSRPLAYLAMAYSAFGCMPEAEQSCRRSLAIRAKYIGASNPALLEGLCELSSYYFRQLKFQESKEAGARAVRICDKTFGTSSSKSGFALLLVGQSEYGLTHYELARNAAERCIANSRTADTKKDAIEARKLLKLIDSHLPIAEH